MSKPKKPPVADSVPPPLPAMPTLDKHRAKFKEVRALNGFLAWLEKNDFSICTRDEGENWCTYNPVMERVEDLSLRYLEIDPAKLEEDRRKLLDWQDEQYNAKQGEGP